MRSSPPLLRIAWRNVRRNARHSVGSLLAISVGFVAISLFDGYVTWLMEDNSDAVADLFMLGDVVVEAKGSSDVAHGTMGKVLLDERGQAFLDGYLASHSREVAAHSEGLYVWGVASAGRSSTRVIAFGYDPESGAKLRGRWAWNTIAGRPLRLASESSVVLGRGLGDLLDCRPVGEAPARGEDGLPIGAERPLSCRRPRVQLVASTESGQINVVEPEVVGLLDGGLKELDMTFAHMPLALAQKLRDTRGVSYVNVRLRDRSRTARFARDVVAAAGAEGIELQAMPWTEHVLGADQRRADGVLNAFRRLMAVVVVLIAGMSVLTTMARAVSERTREIGTLRSVGFRRGQIVRLFAIEAALLAVLASGIGLAATVVLTAAANASGVTYSAGLFAQPIPLAVRYLPGTWAAAAALLSAIAATAAVLPARAAARIRIPEALTHA